MAALGAAYRGIVAAFAVIAGIIIALVAVTIPVNVVLKAGFTLSLYGLLDLIEYGLMAATFLAAPWVLTRNAHVSVDLGLMALAPARRAQVLRLTSLLGALACATVFYYSLDATLASAARGSTVRTSFVFPEWWGLAVMPLSMALLTIEFVRRLVQPADTGRNMTGL